MELGIFRVAKSSGEGRRFHIPNASATGGMADGLGCVIDCCVTSNGKETPLSSRLHAVVCVHWHMGAFPGVKQPYLIRCTLEPRPLGFAVADLGHFCIAPTQSVAENLDGIALAESNTGFVKVLVGPRSQFFRGRSSRGLPLWRSGRLLFLLRLRFRAGFLFGDLGGRHRLVSLLLLRAGLRPARVWQETWRVVIVVPVYRSGRCRRGGPAALPRCSAHRLDCRRTGPEESADQGKSIRLFKVSDSAI